MEMIYHVCRATGLFELATQVNGYLKTGWEPQGGIFVIKNIGADDNYYQAIILRTT
jgi:hypothetical protein